MPRRKSLVVLLNDICPLRCEHCSVGYSSSFNGSANRVDIVKLHAILGSMDTSVYGRVILAGGEPSRTPDLLVAVIDSCHDFGLEVAVTTAPVWATSHIAATRFLEKIRGIDTVILSYDKYHLNFLKVERYRIAVSACHDLGIAVDVHVSYANCEDLGLIDELGDCLDKVRIVSKQKVMPVGNAATLPDVYTNAVTLNTVQDMDAIKRSCTIGNALVNTLSDVHACCWSAGVANSPLEFGSLSQMESDATFKTLTAHGLLGSLDDTGKELAVNLLKGRKIVNECHMCIELMSSRALSQITLHTPATTNETQHTKPATRTGV